MPSQATIFQVVRSKYSFGLNTATREVILLDAIIRFSLRNRLVVIACTLLTFGFGITVAQNLPIDVLPDITKPTVTIMTEAHGMAPEEVESRVTFPLEAVLNGLPNVDRIRSQSGIGLSAIYVEFQWGSDIYRNRQLVQERLTLAKERLPKDVTPIMGPVASLMGQIQQIALYSKNGQTNPMQLRDLAEWTLRPRLLGIPGVAQVISIGGGLKQYQILLSAEKLNQQQISIDQVDRTLSQVSQNTTGGFLDRGSQELLVRHIGIVETLDDLKKTLVGLHFGRPVLVEDVATVVEAPRLKRGDGSFNGSPSVVMTIQKAPGTDTVTITRDVERAVKEIAPTLSPDIVINTDVFKQADFIERSIRGIQGKMLVGSIFVFLVLFVFLANFRMSLVTLIAIPISFCVTAIVFKVLGLTVNTMTLGGLAIAIGELVDDSIVDVENVDRRLRENNQKGARGQARTPFLKTIFDASSEIRNSIVLATIIIALVFLPLFNLEGIEGRLFTPLAVSYLTALVASLLVALTITPVLCSFLLNSRLPTITSSHETRFVQWLKQLDQRILNWALDRPSLILSAAGFLFLVSLALIPWMGRNFLPQFNEGTAMVSVIAPAGVSLNESNRIGGLAETTILKTPEVKSVSRRTGRAELDEHAMSINVSEIDVDFKTEGRARPLVLNEIRDSIARDIPGVSVNIGQPLGHLIDHMLSGVNAAIAIKLFGSDLQVLREKGAEIRAALNDTEGLVDLRIENQGRIPQLKIRVLREEAAKFGMSPGEVTTLLEGAYNGQTVAQVLEGTRLYDIYYRFDDDSRSSQQKMEKTVLKTMPDGRKVLLEQVADVYEASGPGEILREAGGRRIVISANASKRDLASLIQEIRTRIETKVSLPPGYYVSYGGQFQSQESATRKLLIFGFLSLLGVAAVLFYHFSSSAITIQIMATIPLAFIGGLYLLFAVDRTITVASLVGFITLCGIASRNSIMMISHYLHLMKFEGESFGRAMIIRGSQERLAPVLMTASVAGLALFPLVFAQGQPGSEILHPVAVVIVGGLFSSTLLDLIVTPTLFYRFGKKSAEDYAKNSRHIDPLERTT